MKHRLTNTKTGETKEVKEPLLLDDEDAFMTLLYMFNGERAFTYKKSNDND